MMKRTLLIGAFCICAGLALAQSGLMPGSRQINGGLASLEREQQIVQGGARVISKCALGYGQVPLSACIPASGSTVTIDFARGPLQYLENNAAFNLAGPALGFEGSIFLLIYNGASAGTITFTGTWNQGSNTGSTYATTSTQQYTFNIWSIDPPGTVGGVNAYSIFAHQ